MSEEEYEVNCLVGGVSVKALISLSENADVCRIDLQLPQYSDSAEADNYFYALINLRKKLEPQNIKLLCKGCSRRVYPSAMILDMGDAIRAYELIMGKQARLKDLVNIFEPCEEQEYASIEEQQTFFEEWFQSKKG